jgi:hypothetical protein
MHIHIYTHRYIICKPCTSKIRTYIYIYIHPKSTCLTCFDRAQVAEVLKTIAGYGYSMRLLGRPVREFKTGNEVHDFVMRTHGQVDAWFYLR